MLGMAYAVLELLEVPQNLYTYTYSSFKTVNVLHFIDNMASVWSLYQITEK